MNQTDEFRRHIAKIETRCVYWNECVVKMTQYTKHQCSHIGEIRKETYNYYLKSIKRSNALNVSPSGAILETISKQNPDASITSIQLPIPDLNIFMKYENIILM